MKEVLATDLVVGDRVRVSSLKNAAIWTVYSLPYQFELHPQPAVCLKMEGWSRPRFITLGKIVYKVDENE